MSTGLTLLGIHASLAIQATRDLWFLHWRKKKSNAEVFAYLNSKYY
jgi:hypothetical protein